MTYQVFAVYDLKACAYSQPCYYSNPQMAMRGFSDGCQDPKSPFAIHPEDFQLFQVGTWDDVAGLFSGVVPPKYICCALDFLPSKAPVAVGDR